VVRPETRLAAAGFKRAIRRCALRHGVERCMQLVIYGAGRWAVAPEVGDSRRFFLGEEVDAAESGGRHRGRPGHAAGEVQPVWSWASASSCDRRGGRGKKWRRRRASGEERRRQGRRERWPISNHCMCEAEHPSGQRGARAVRRCRRRASQRVRMACPVAEVPRAPFQNTLWVEQPESDGECRHDDCERFPAHPLPLPLSLQPASLSTSGSARVLPHSAGMWCFRSN
jgi:hypothetical protein